jgi:hypothetical protein
MSRSDRILSRSFHQPGAQDRRQVGRDLGEVQHRHQLRLLARETEQVGDEACGAVCGRLNVLDVLVGRIARAMGLEKKIREADDGGQHVVEIVGDAARQLADGFHFLGLCKALFKRLLLRHVDDVELPLRRCDRDRRGDRRGANTAVVAAGDFDRLHVAAAGQDFSEASVDAGAFFGLSVAAECAGREDVVCRAAIEYHAHEGGVATCDAAFRVERRDAERRRLEKL